MPPMRDHGYGLEAHGQNTLARFDASGNLIGFAVRDFGTSSFKLSLDTRWVCAARKGKAHHTDCHARALGACEHQAGCGCTVSGSRARRARRWS